MSSEFNIPAGFALVPLEPTEDMWTAGRDPVMHRDLNHKPALFPCDAGECPAWQRNPKTGKPELDTSKGTTAVHVWRAMVAAAPTPPIDAVPDKAYDDFVKWGDHEVPIDAVPGEPVAQDVALWQLVYGAMLGTDKTPKSVDDFEAAAKRVAEMIERVRAIERAHGIIPKASNA